MRPSDFVFYIVSYREMLCKHYFVHVFAKKFQKPLDSILIGYYNGFTVKKDRKISQ